MERTISERGLLAELASYEHEQPTNNPPPPPSAAAVSVISANNTGHDHRHHHHHHQQQQQQQQLVHLHPRVQAQERIGRVEAAQRRLSRNLSRKGREERRRRRLAEHDVINSPYSPRSDNDGGNGNVTGRDEAVDRSTHLVEVAQWQLHFHS